MMAVYVSWYGASPSAPPSRPIEPTPPKRVLDTGAPRPPKPPKVAATWWWWAAAAAGVAIVAAIVLWLAR